MAAENPDPNVMERRKNLKSRPFFLKSGASFSKPATMNLIVEESIGKSMRLNKRNEVDGIHHVEAHVGPDLEDFLRRILYRDIIILHFAVAFSSFFLSRPCQNLHRFPE
jgi:hypothetical protein